MKLHRLAAAAAAAVMLTGCGGEQQTSQYTMFAMDTCVTLSGCCDRQTLENAGKEITRLEKLWSVNIKGSDIYRLDHEGSAELSDETAELLRYSLSISERTDGALDPTVCPLLKEWGFTTDEHHVPDSERISELLKNTGWQRLKLDGNRASLPEGMAVDTGAVAKGYAADIIAEKLRADGVSAGIIDLGGNVLTFGEKPDGSSWKISVRDPFGEGTAGTLSLGECSVVTSGSYERCFEQDGIRYHHIIDPATGRPADSGLESVTVIADESRLCDALSTALFVMGEDKAFDFWRESRDFEMIMITSDKRLLISEGIADKFEQSRKGTSYTAEVISR